MIFFDENNLSPVRKRTLKRLTRSAIKLYQEQHFPSPGEITRDAGYARVTLKSYFSTYDEFIEYVVKGLIDLTDKPEMGSNAEDNIEKLFCWGFHRLGSHEAIMRDAVRIAQQRWQENIAGKNNDTDSPLLRKAHRRIALAEALSPVADRLPDAALQNLLMLMSVLCSTETMTVLKDSFMLSNEEISALASWGARLMLRQALAEAAAT